MKKAIYLLAFMLAIFSSCEMLEKDTTYTFVSVHEKYIVIESAEGRFNVNCKCVYSIYEHLENGLTIQHNTINEPETGKEYKFTANPETKYLTVKCQWEAPFHGIVFTGTSYIINAFVVRAGENTKIEITSDTLFGQEEPK